MQVLESLEKYSWYLDSTLIPLALLDDDVPEIEKKEIADAILDHSEKYHRVEQFTYGSKQPVDVMKNLEFDPDKATPPSMAKLIDDHSMFIFVSFEITKTQLADCFALLVSYWHTQSCFKSFKEFALNLTVVNDPAERAIGISYSYIQNKI